MLLQMLSNFCEKSRGRENAFNSFMRLSRPSMSKDSEYCMSLLILSESSILVIGFF